jgi:predicted transposase/invertase (TIGR01784 family)
MLLVQEQKEICTLYKRKCIEKIKKRNNNALPSTAAQRLDTKAKRAAVCVSAPVRKKIPTQKITHFPYLKHLIFVEKTFPMAKKHIRFDWAAKKILRDKKNFDILEGFLSELLKEDIKIEGLLESESNQEEEDDKFNRVDLYAENSKGEHIIIEIQNTRELDYLMRMLFGTSKAITEYLEIGKPYSDIKKVIAVSIIYFGLGKGDDYIYIGQTKFTGLHTKKELELTKTQQELLKKPSVQEAFPEYYLIQTIRFNDVINEPLDEWIYFFKNNEVLDSFKAKGMKAVREKMAIHNLPEEERKKYDRFLDNLHTEASIADTVRIEQEEKIKEERENAERRKTIQITLNLIKLGLDNTQISQVTGLSESEIENLRDNPLSA